MSSISTRLGAGMNSVNTALLEGYVTQDINPGKYFGTAEVGDYVSKLVKG